MQKYRNQILLGFIFAIGIYIFYLLIADSQLQVNDSATMQETLNSFRWEILPLLILTQSVVIFFRFIEWHYFLGVIGAHGKISLADSAILQISGFTLVVSPGKSAEVLKSVFLKVKTGIPIAKSMPIVFAERIIDGLAVILIMSGTILIAGNQLNLGAYNGIDYDALSRLITFTSLGAITAGLIVVQIQPLAYAVLGIISKTPFIRRIHAPLITFYESSREIFSLRHVLPMMLVGVGVYLPSAICLILILAGFGLEITWQLCLQATFIVGVTSAIGALSFVPNGAGITEISNVGMLLAFVAPLNPLMTVAVATAVSLIQGFFHKWFRVLVGLIVAFLFRHRLFAEGIEQEIAQLETEKITH